MSGAGTAEATARLRPRHEETRAAVNTRKCSEGGNGGDLVFVASCKAAWEDICVAFRTPFY